ncbi:MAG: bacillithiol biosynthesis cysteine-adding enzyme BshC [Gemmatimonadaceae bacterium]
MTTLGGQLRLMTVPIGGGPLARSGQADDAPPGWFTPAPTTVEAWRERANAVRDQVPTSWLQALSPAFDATGAAKARLTSAAEGRGVVVTTGQQPGLFGGPLYTWTKAVTVRALADELQQSLGIPVAPVFWAATDDSDFAEGAATVVNVAGGCRELRLTSAAPAGVSVSHIPIGEVQGLVDELTRACGSGADPRALEAVRRAYHPGATVGSAYLALLRELLEPLGVAVLDAAHPATRLAAHSLYVHALRRADDVQAALVDRVAEIRSAGFEPQVSDMDELSLVFDHREGRRTRIPRRDAAERASSAVPGSLSPNVLLRPVAERQILPTVSYAAGPGEFAYFAQVSAVAKALDAAAPLAVPRWSATIIEPHVDRLLARYELTVEALENPHGVARRLSERATPSDLSQSVEAMREQLTASAQSLRAALRGHDGLVPENTVDAIERAIAWRLDRFERRLRAGVRRHDATLAHDLGTLGGALFPNGTRQERALNVVPLLVRHGLGLLDRMTEEARGHARRLVQGSNTRGA